MKKLCELKDDEKVIVKYKVLFGKLNTASSVTLK